MGKRALSVDNVLNQKHHVLEFENEWRSAFGTRKWVAVGLSGVDRAVVKLD